MRQNPPDLYGSLRPIIDRKYDRCVARVVHRLRRIPSAQWQEDGAPERDLWDHWKREMQEEHSFFHGLLEDMVEAEVHRVLEGLSHEDGALMTLATDALDDLDEEPIEPTFVPDAVSAELVRRVNARASDEPHRASVQRHLDDQARDRFERDMEPYRQ